ncbi:MAG: hypothetical protein AAB917_03000 [Patescibacteria group bacterium]
MSDEKHEEEEKELIHGFDIHAGEHTRALEYMIKNMNEKQVKDMVHIAKGGHGADFKVVMHGQENKGHHEDYKLVHEGGKLRISRAHHN